MSKRHGLQPPRPINLIDGDEPRISKEKSIPPSPARPAEYSGDFDLAYDEAYEEHKKARKPKASFMQAMLETAKDRQERHQAARMRSFQREAAKDAGQFADKEVFVTSSYKKKAEAMKQNREHKPSREEVFKQEEMGRFYSALFKRNSSFRIDEKYGSRNKAEEGDEIIGPKRKK